jgi:predicted enzyme related to lactoylglutathione lyase
MPNPRFRWYELMTTDAEAAGGFYRAVVGWTTQDVGGPGMAYTTFHVGGAAGMAGMLTLSPEALAGGAKPGWIGYLAVPDVDDYARRLVAAGGTVHQPPTDIPGILRFAGVKDPTGAPFVIYRGVPQAGEPDSGPPEGAPDEPGYVGWRELLAGDGQRAFDFYAGLFGWNEAAVFDMGPMGAYRLWSTTGARGMDAAEGGMMTAPPGGPAPVWNFYFQVDGIDAAAARIAAAGGQVINGPHAVPSDDWIVQALDPQGAPFNLISATK